MAGFKVKEGDYGKGWGDIGFNTITLDGGSKNIPIEEVEAVEEISEKTSKDRLQKFSATIVGSVLLGPAGGVVGGLSAGNKEKVAFAVKFKDGTAIFAEGNKKVYEEFKKGEFCGS